jgi:hypothetical protein
MKHPRITARFRVMTPLKESFGIGTGLPIRIIRKQWNHSGSRKKSICLAVPMEKPDNRLF